MKMAPQNSFSILMIDDEKRFNDLYKELIENQFPVTVEFALNGQEGIDKVIKRADKEPFELIILDLDMPVKDGTTTLKELRQVESYEKIPVLILTANDSFSNQEYLLELGASDFISKGASPELFSARIKNLIDYRLRLKSLDQSQKDFNAGLEFLCSSYLSFTERVFSARPNSTITKKNNAFKDIHLLYSRTIDFISKSGEGNGEIEMTNKVASNDLNIINDIACSPIEKHEKYQSIWSSFTVYQSFLILFGMSLAENGTAPFIIHNEAIRLNPELESKALSDEHKTLSRYLNINISQR